MKRLTESGESVLHSQGDSVQFWGVDPPGNLGQLRGRNLPEIESQALEFRFQAEDRFQQFGMGFLRAADEQALVAGSDPLGCVGAIESQADQNGSEPSRTAFGRW